MRLLYSFEIRIGTFFIAERAGRFHPVYDGESLGSYARPEQAAADLAGGHTFAARADVDTAELGIPDDLAEWKRMWSAS